MLIHFLLVLEQYRECQGEYFVLTVSFRRDGKEEASMEKSGLGIFMQTALLKAKECTRKPSATDVLEWSPMQVLSGQNVILKCHPQPHGITSQEQSESLGFWTSSIVWYPIS
jgi:hypothetical protein